MAPDAIEQNPNPGRRLWGLILGRLAIALLLLAISFWTGNTTRDDLWPKTLPFIFLVAALTVANAQKHAAVDDGRMPHGRLRNRPSLLQDPCVPGSTPDRCRYLFSYLAGLELKRHSFSIHRALHRDHRDSESLSKA